MKRQNTARRIRFAVASTMTEKVFPYELPENWQWTTLGNVAKIFTDNSINEKIKQENYVERTDRLIYIATKDIGFDNKINYDTQIKVPESENFKVAPKDITLLCIEDGSAGKKIDFTDQPVCFVNKLCTFVSQKINSRRIYFFMQTEFFESVQREKTRLNRWRVY